MLDVNSDLNGETPTIEVFLNTHELSPALTGARERNIIARSAVRRETTTALLRRRRSLHSSLWSGTTVSGI